MTPEWMSSSMIVHSIPKGTTAAQLENDPRLLEACLKIATIMEGIGYSVYARIVPLSVAAAVTKSGATAVCAQAAGIHHVALVVEHGSGTSLTACVAFSTDSLTGEQVMDLLVDAAREQGTTVILVTHEPRVAAYADREIIVRDGQISAYVPDRVAS